MKLRVGINPGNKYEVKMKKSAYNGGDKFLLLVRCIDISPYNRRFFCIKNSLLKDYRSCNPFPARILGVYFAILDDRVLDCLGCEK